MAKAKNISGQPQHFVGIGTFQPDEALPVTAEQAEVLKKSPHMHVSEDQPQKQGNKFKAVEKNNHSVRGVEAE